MTSPVQFEVNVTEAVVVRPGDTLVLRTDADVTMEELDHLMSAASEQLPGVKLLVLALNGQMFTYRPEEQP